ncbi:ATP-binding protein [Xenorhabdus bovienii]|uniref:ATP-binding protein n=1 Tax=Xenorhabdus bovienii TaxID=40576 RepID=UPI0023B2DCCC|nr:ATP-binding protein [Xenorhabdus bovienii]MDE9562623.1 ATP-binding protein [Xenorhabdus bovienii]
MLRSTSFQTRARTIDHLGREQIADCPTAISELWKNAYDAYATNVELHLFDGEISVAAILDNGHGMNRNEFESKWLTVGTESKTNGFDVSKKDRNGLALRPKQGQKGIGRLSSAALGPLLLFISKRENDSFIAALIDWRLFENPFLLLNDIRIPVTEFEECHDLAKELPVLFEHLMGNIWGDKDDGVRNLRLSEAWTRFSEQEHLDGIEQSTRDRIVQTLISEVFLEKHFEKWDVWNDNSQHGTAMFIADIQDDLLFQLSNIPLNDAEDTEKVARDQFFQTLSNFTDPFSKSGEPSTDNFKYLVKVWHDNIPKTILGESTEFDLKNLKDLEHIIEGQVDSEGFFKGRVKVFGKWIENYTIKPKQIYKTRKDSAVGPFLLRVGTFELQRGSTTLSSEQHASFNEQADKYAGFRLYRDGLRVMPYGRVDSDYFSIEFRRSKNAGRYFWSNRRMFGRVAITRNENPNLKDKAGREGIIDNKASKIFKGIVENILISAADRYFGSKSEDRTPQLEDIREQREKIKAEEDRKKLQSKERRRIRLSINENLKPLISYVEELISIKSVIGGRSIFNSIFELQKLKLHIDKYNEKIKEFSLSPIPPNLGRLEDEYRSYRKHELAAKEIVKELTLVINKAIADSTQKSDIEKASEIFRSKLSSINNGITRYASKGKEMLLKQQIEFDELVKFCRNQFKLAVENDLEDLKLGTKTLRYVLNKLDEEHEKIEVDNSQKLSPYITALERINEQIDLEGLAIHSINETIRYKEEISRLHALAQLGITVEIVGHELEGLDRSISYGLKLISQENLSDTQLKSYQDVMNSHITLMEKLRFLSPLKLSGEKISRVINGKDIYEYVYAYFRDRFENQNIKFSASDEFKNMNVLEIPSRIYPIFVNIVNNSQYWIQRCENNKREIFIDIKGNEVFISDDGPGVDKDDLDQLFTLFFTRKQRGGRGVGLYLSKQNLQAGGHKIRYETRESMKILPGANFAIEFMGMKHG